MLNELSLERKKELEELAVRYHEVIVSKRKYSIKNLHTRKHNYLSPKYIISELDYLYSKEFKNK